MIVCVCLCECGCATANVSVPEWMLLNFEAIKNNSNKKKMWTGMHLFFLPF